MGDFLLIFCAIAFALQIIWAGHFIKENGDLYVQEIIAYTKINSAIKAKLKIFAFCFFVKFFISYPLINFDKVGNINIFKASVKMEIKTFYIYT